MGLRSTVQFCTLLIAVLSVCIGGTYALEEGASVLASELGRASNESLLWGPYRPNLYFGVRPRLPKSLSTGLLWSMVEDFQSVQSSMG